MSEFLELPSPILRILEFLAPFLKFAWQIIRNWWWLPLPFLLWRPLTFLWIWWRQGKWDATQKRVLLEIKVPKEVLKPIRAMEHVFAGIHSLHDVVVWREKWIEGQFQLSISLELVSIGGDVHFYIRTPKSFRDVLESNIYSQYPDVEITEAEDYAKKIPQDIPNKNWDLFGFDMVNTKPSPYPIKTYTEFEKEIALEATEEKRIDPLSNLLEGMASLRPGEQLWVQIVARPIRTEIAWVESGRKIIEKITRRAVEEAPSQAILKDALDVIITGEPPKEAERKEEIMPPEMKLTPGERQLVQAIEQKITKFGFSCNIRFIYLGEKSVFFKPRARIPFSFYKAISYGDVGGLKPWKVTATKVKTVFLWFLDQRRAYLRKRKLFKNYVRRVGPLFPMHGGTFVLNTEELATLFHFPSRGGVPTAGIKRIESVRKEAPPGLPME